MASSGAVSESPAREARARAPRCMSARAPPGARPRGQRGPTAAPRRPWARPVPCVPVCALCAVVPAAVRAARLLRGRARARTLLDARHVALALAPLARAARGQPEQVALAVVRAAALVLVRVRLHQQPAAGGRPLELDVLRLVERLGGDVRAGLELRVLVHAHQRRPALLLRHERRQPVRAAAPRRRRGRERKLGDARQLEPRAHRAGARADRAVVEVDLVGDELRGERLVRRPRRRRPLVPREVLLLEARDDGGAAAAVRVRRARRRAARGRREAPDEEVAVRAVDELLPRHEERRARRERHRRHRRPLDRREHAPVAAVRMHAHAALPRVEHGHEAAVGGEDGGGGGADRRVGQRLELRRAREQLRAILAAHEERDRRRRRRHRAAPSPRRGGPGGWARKVATGLKTSAIITPIRGTAELTTVKRNQGIKLRFRFE